MNISLDIRSFYVDESTIKLIAMPRTFGIAASYIM